MIYTIATLDVDEITLSIDKKGNVYQLIWFDREEKRVEKKEFDNLSDAFNRFKSISQLLVFHDYSHEQKIKAMLSN